MIGYVNEQESAAPENVLTSVAWNTQLTWETIAEDVAQDDFRPGKAYHVGVAVGGVVVEPNPEYKDPIDAEALALYEEALEKIQNGEFEVPFIIEGSAKDVEVSL